MPNRGHQHWVKKGMVQLEVTKAKSLVLAFFAIFFGQPLSYIIRDGQLVQWSKRTKILAEKPEEFGYPRI